ncbi:DUF484 family protein [Kangiella sp. HZ709]|uniref:DUF484 family protein n=1 Tax=Kangiella sp. HZ709 TaxID=2666328 RepID=UPI0012AF54A2|nr:DUF484 family protein [Kangiella sp. HZ709]MRX28032.1 DUF484 family protein [Kangiella sp. HZ709]
MNPDKRLPRNGIIEQKVVEYLEKNPDFFHYHDELLNKIKLNHNVYGSVSLVEKQILNLREREQQLKAQLKVLMQTANDNSELLLRASNLSVKLISARSEQELVDSLQHQMINGFGLDACRIWLFDPSGTLNHVNYGELATIQQLSDQRFITEEPACGRVTDSSVQIFDGEKSIESYALIPLGEGAQMGIIALGSKDANLFTADLGTLFLRLIGDVMYSCMEKYQE